MVSIAKVKKRVESQAESREYLWLANQLLEQGELSEALIIVNKGLQYHINDLSGLLLQANIKQLLGDFDGAKELWTQLSNQYPSMLRPYKGLFEIALEQNDIDESRLHFNKLKGIDPFFTPKAEEFVEGSQPIEESSLNLIETSESDLSPFDGLDESEGDTSLDLSFESESQTDDIESPIAEPSEVPLEEESFISEPATEPELDLADTSLISDEQMSGVDSSAVGEALDDIFGEDETDDFVFSTPIDENEVEELNLEVPTETNEALNFEPSPSEGEVVKLPTLDLADDEDDDFGFGDEAFAETAIIEEPLVETLEEESKEDVVTGTDVSDALDEIFGELEEDDFDESLLGASDTERIIPGQDPVPVVTSDDVNSEATEDIFGDSEDTLDKLVDEVDEIPQAIEDELIANPTISSDNESTIEEEPEEESLGEAVASELDALFEEDSDDDLFETPTPEENSVEVPSEEVTSNDEDSVFTSNTFEVDNSEEDALDTFAPVEEIKENAADELTSLDDDQDDIFGGLDDGSSDQYFNLEGDQATSDSDLSSELSSLDEDDDIDESIFEDPTAGEAHDSSETPTVTLAEIYFEQELFDRSISMYKELINMESENESQVQNYQARIKEIKDQMSADS